MPRVKICGLCRVEDAHAVAAAGADYAGCILTAGFKRSVTVETARALRAVLPDSVPLVGVFVDDSIDRIAELLFSGVIQIAQLHGGESAEFIRALKARTDAPVWKAFKVTHETDFTSINTSPADLVLLDAGQGCGERFDWSLAALAERSFILAGGLTPANVAQAAVQTRPFAVDTSSGVESEGAKDAAKIAAFAAAVRALETAPGSSRNM